MEGLIRFSSDSSSSRLISEQILALRAMEAGMEADMSSMILPAEASTVESMRNRGARLSVLVDTAVDAAVDLLSMPCRDSPTPPTSPETF